MRISVVIATYNGEDYLREQLNSVVSQTRLPDEIVFVDDASKDGTLKIIQSFMREYSSIDFINIFRDKNIGYIENFIDGIFRCTGDIVFLCDQDDLWLEDKIEYSIKFFEYQSDCVVLHTNTDMINSQGDILKRNLQEYSKKSLKISSQQYIKKVNYPGMSMVFKRKPILEYLIKILTIKDIELPTHDWVIGYIGIQINGFYISDRVLTYRRYTGNNVALDIDSKRISSIQRRINGIELYRKYYKFLETIQNNIEVSYTYNVRQLLAVSAYRINYLEEKSLLKCLKSFCKVKFFPSKKSYFADLIILIRHDRSY